MKKKSIKRGKLHLTSEAVRSLTNTQLDAVAGGDIVIVPSGHNSCRNFGCRGVTLQ